MPIVFDAQMNEFHLKHDRGEMVLYYCPFCGWAAPDSLRASFFARMKRPRIVEAPYVAFTGDLFRGRKAVA